MKLVQSIPECNFFFQNGKNISETCTKWFRNCTKCTFSPTFFKFLEQRCCSLVLNSPHMQFGGFRLVPYSTVSSLVNNLDDQLYNTFPKQPDPKPSSKGTKPNHLPKLQMSQPPNHLQVQEPLPKLLCQMFHQMTTLLKRPIFGQRSLNWKAGSGKIKWLWGFRPG